MDLVRTIVSKGNNRIQKDNFNLDFTYITQRIIAMSFPSSGIETIYRNKIDDVVAFVNKYHMDHYKIINLSHREYDYSKFGNNVYLKR